MSPAFELGVFVLYKYKSKTLHKHGLKHRNLSVQFISIYTTSLNTQVMLSNSKEHQNVSTPWMEEDETTSCQISIL